MNRYGTRDARLTLRIALGLAGTALLYLAGVAVLVLLIRAGTADGGSASVALLGYLGLITLPLVVCVYYFNAGRLAIRLLKAKREPLGDALGPIIQRLAAQANVDVPEILVVHSWAANSLAAERPRAKAAIIVTTELLRRLDPAEVESVLAHELSHLVNQDARVMAVVGGPAIVSAGTWHGNLASRIFTILLAPFWATGLFLMLSIARSREYAADRGSALLTGRPEQLMSALTKLQGLQPRGDLRGGTAVRAFCIVGRHESRFGLLRDHPPVEKRLAALERLTRELGGPARDN